MTITPFNNAGGGGFLGVISVKDEGGDPACVFQESAAGSGSYQLSLTYDQCGGAENSTTVSGQCGGTENSTTGSGQCCGTENSTTQCGVAAG